MRLRSSLVSRSVAFRRVLAAAAAGAAAIWVLLASGAAPRAWAEKRAFLVSVPTYDRGLQALPHADSDTARFERILHDLMAYDQVVRLHSGRQDVRLTKIGILAEFDAFLQNVNSNDVLFIVFSSHGGQYQKTQEYFLCPKNADITDVTTLISVEEDIFSRLENKGRLRIVLIDACRAQDANAPSENLDSVTAPEEAGAGTFALYSCGPKQFSYWARNFFFDRKTNKYEDASIFLGVAAQGLLGFADRLQQDRNISLEEWARYIEDETKRRAAEIHRVRQQPHPSRMVAGAREEILASIPGAVIYHQGDLDRSKLMPPPNEQLDFRNVDFIEVDFTRYNLPRIERANFYRARFIRCNLSGLRFDYCRFVNAVFDSGDLSHADFTKVNSFRGVKYRKHAVNTTGTLWPSDEQPEEID